jgi:thiamine monophosphate kinase
MNSGSFKPGDRVVVTGSPGRSQSQILYIRRLDRPSDGLRYEQIGTTPHIRIPGKQGK